MPGWDGFDVPGFVLDGLGEVAVVVDNDVNVMALGEHAIGFPRRRPPDVRQGRHGNRQRDHQRRAAAPRCAGGRRRPRPHPGAPRRRRRVPVRQRRLPRSRRQRRGRGRPAAGRRASRPASSRDVAALVRGGSVLATQLVREAGRTIGEVLASAVSLLNPSVIVIGGSLVRGRRPAARRRARGRLPPLAAAGHRPAAHRPGVSRRPLRRRRRRRDGDRRGPRAGCGRPIRGLTRCGIITFVRTEKLLDSGALLLDRRQKRA